MVLLVSGAAMAQVGEDSVTPRPVQDSPRRNVPTPDTLRKKDTVRPKTEPVTPVAPVTQPVQAVGSFSKKPPVKDTGWKEDPNIPLNVQIMNRHPYFGFATEPVRMTAESRRSGGKELLFYVLIALLLFFAFLRNAFSKYFSNLFRLFFRTTHKGQHYHKRKQEHTYYLVYYKNYENIGISSIAEVENPSYNLQSQELDEIYACKPDTTI